MSAAENSKQPSDQSDCSAAWMPPTSDQGHGFEPWMVDPRAAYRKGFEVARDFLMPAVARRPADFEGVLDKVVKWLRDRIRDCESEAWKAAWRGNYERSAIMDVRKKAYQFTVEEIRDIQNQSSEPGQGSAR